MFFVGYTYYAAVQRVLGGAGLWSYAQPAQGLRPCHPGLPLPQGLRGDNRSSRPIDAACFRNSLTDKTGGETRKRQEEIAIERERAVGPGIAETHEFDLDGEILPVVEKIEGAPVDEMPPDTPVRMFLVMPELEAQRLLGIGRRNLFLEQKILLEKFAVFHYYMYKVVERIARHTLCVWGKDGTLACWSFPLFFVVSRPLYQNRL